MAHPQQFQSNNYVSDSPYQADQPYAGKGQDTYQERPQGNVPLNYVENGIPYRESSGLPLEWLFFIIGFIFPILWVIGSFLPLCRRPRFESRKQKGGWIACVVATCLAIVVVIIAVVAVSVTGSAVAKQYKSQSDLQQAQMDRMRQLLGF